MRSVCSLSLGSCPWCIYLRVALLAPSGLHDISNHFSFFFVFHPPYNTLQQLIERLPIPSKWDYSRSPSFIAHFFSYSCRSMNGSTPRGRFLLFLTPFTVIYWLFTSHPKECRHYFNIYPSTLPTPILLSTQDISRHWMLSYQEQKVGNFNQKIIQGRRRSLFTFSFSHIYSRPLNSLALSLTDLLLNISSSNLLYLLFADLWPIFSPVTVDKYSVRSAIANQGSIKGAKKRENYLVLKKWALPCSPSSIFFPMIIS